MEYINVSILIDEKTKKLTPVNDLSFFISHRLLLQKLRFWGFQVVIGHGEIKNVETKF